MQLPTSHPALSTQQPYPQILLFGDSITQVSEPTLLPPLRAAYTRKADLLNRGFSGYTSPMALSILPHIHPWGRPGGNPVPLLTVFFGANDACLPAYSQHVPLDRYVSSLEQIVGHQCVAAQNTKVLLVTPGPVDEWGLTPSDPDDPHSPLSRTAANTRRYADACRDVGARTGVPVVDLWASFMAAAGWKGDEEGAALPGSKDCPRNEVLGRLLPDGLHFSPEAYDIMGRELMKVVDEKYPDCTPDRMPMMFPAWDDILGKGRLQH